MCDRQLLFINITLKRFADGFVLKENAKQSTICIVIPIFMLMEVSKQKQRKKRSERKKMQAKESSERIFKYKK